MGAQTPLRRPTGAQVVAIVAGSVLALVALGLLLGGGALLWANGQKDDQGYLKTHSERFATTTYALATDNLDVSSGDPDWLVSTDRYGKIRLQARSHDGKPVFVGIARTADVTRYLGGTAHTAVTDVDFSPFSADYRAIGGDRRPALPAAQSIWVAAAHGTGAQTLTWDVEHGNWSVVVMNADASAGVDVGVSAGANVPVLSTIAWSTTGGGVVLLTAAGVLLFLSIRTPRRRNEPSAPGPVAIAA
jgi:hypothetical protein